MPYEAQTWNNGEAGGTPITAERLNHIEGGIQDAQAGVEQAIADLDDQRNHTHTPASLGAIATAYGTVTQIDAIDTATYESIPDPASTNPTTLFVITD